MNNYRAAVLVVTCYVLGCLVQAAEASSAVDVWSADWSATGAGNLAQNPPSNEAVDAFMLRLAPTFCGEPGYVPAADSFRFADLRHSGTLSMVAALECRPQSRGLNGGLLVVDKAASGFEMYGPRVGSPGVGGGIESVQDLRGDGNLELVVPTALTWYEGAVHCIATWPVVYAWTGAGYTNVSDRFMDFYQRRLGYLNDQIAALPPLSDTSANPPLSGQPGFENDCIKAEAAKIQRVLGVSANAGLDQAIALANSSNPAKRDFALSLLADIGTPEALNYLQKIATSWGSRTPNIPQSLLANALKSGSPNQLGPAEFMSVPLSSVPSAPK